MANSVRIELNSAGVRELLKSSEMQNIVKSKADEIQSRCGTGYVTDTYNAGTRVIASVATSDYESMQDQYENNTLLKALK